MEDDKLVSSSEAKPNSWQSLACFLEVVLSVALVDGVWRKNGPIVSVERSNSAFATQWL